MAANQRLTQHEKEEDAGRLLSGGAGGMLLASLFVADPALWFVGGALGAILAAQRNAEIRERRKRNQSVHQTGDVIHGRRSR